MRSDVHWMSGMHVIGKKEKKKYMKVVYLVIVHQVHMKDLHKVIKSNAYVKGELE